MTTKFTAQEMLGYRDSVVKCLKDELELLNDMHQYGMFNKDEGIITRENYPHKVEIIKGEITKLENFDVVLSVVGTMKAGKSTTINAIVGREILPNRNRPMTALPTLIYHTPEQTEPVLSFHNQAVNEFVGKLKTHLQNHTHLHELPELKAKEMKALIAKIQAGWTFQPEYHGEEAIFEFLFGLNDLVRLAGYINEKDKSIEFPFAECRNIEQLPQIKVAFRHLTHIPTNQGRLVLLDTPGPNEAGQKRLRGMLTEQLQRSSAVMLVLDYSQLKSDASESVKQQLSEVPTISKERLFALVNKFDQKTANSDDEEQTKNLISQEFLPEKIEREHIYPLAAQTAFLANRMAAELASKGKPEWTEGSWFNDFIKLAYGTRMKADKWKHEKIEDIQEAIDELIEESRVQIPLQEAIIQTQIEAPKIALQAAMSQLEPLVKEIHNLANSYAHTAKLKSEEEIQFLESKLSKLHEQVKELASLQKSTKETLPTTVANIKKVLDDEFSDIENNISQVVKGDFQEKESDLEKEKTELEKKSKMGYWLFTLETTEEREKRKILLKKVSSRLNEMKDKSISSFDNSDEAKNFLKQIQEDMQEFTDEIMKNIQKNADEAQRKLGSEIENVQLKSHFLFDEIHQSLEKEGFEFEKPDFQTKALQSYGLQFPEMDTYIHTKREMKQKRQSGFIGWGKRVLGSLFGKKDWGYEEYEQTEYQISEDKIRDAFFKKIKSNIDKIKDDIDQIFDEFEVLWIEEYVGNIQSTAQNLLDEISVAIKTNRDNQHRAEEYRNQMQRFSKRNGYIRANYERYAKVINAK